MSGKPKNAARHMSTRDELWRDWWAKKVCRAIGHDEENRFTGDIICARCRVGLGRWRS